MNFAENLKKYREAAGYKTAKEFAAALGIGYTTYVGYENKGREPNYETLCDIAQKLNISIDDLVGNTPPPTLADYVRIARDAGCRIDEVKDTGEFKVETPIEDEYPVTYYECYMSKEDFCIWIYKSLYVSSLREKKRFPYVLVSVLQSLIMEKNVVWKKIVDDK